MMEKGGDQESTSTVGSFSESSINSGESPSSELVEDASSSSTSNSSLLSSDSPLSTRLGPLYQLSELMTNLPIKRGLSKFYEGKSESFTSMESIENLAKRKRPSSTQQSKKLKPRRSYGGRSESDDHISTDLNPTAVIVEKSSSTVLASVGKIKEQYLV